MGHKYETKFDFDQEVYTITRETKTEYTVCSFCSGNKEIKGNDGRFFNCPSCLGSGNGKSIWSHTEWRPVTTPYRVGYIQIKHTNEHQEDVDSDASNYGSMKEQYNESYMLRETGIGSGNVYFANDLFESIAAADDECERRNNGES